MNGDDLNWVDWLALVLVIIGALNWGLVGLGLFANGNWNVVEAIFGFSQSLLAIIYIIVGLAGLWAIWTAYKAGQWE